jgi:hypothetical protein
MLGPLLEFPVTIYQKNCYARPFGWQLRPQVAIKKYDVDWFGSADEARQALDEARLLGLRVLILFLHSYSFMDGKGGTGERLPDSKALETFDAVLGYIDQKNLKVATFRDLAERRVELDDLTREKDVIPQIGADIGLAEYAVRLSGLTRNDYWMVGVSFAGAAGIVAICALRRRRAGGTTRDKRARASTSTTNDRQRTC